MKQIFRNTLLSKENIKRFYSDILWTGNEKHHKYRKNYNHIYYFHCLYICHNRSHCHHHYYYYYYYHYYYHYYYYYHFYLHFLLVISNLEFFLSFIIFPFIRFLGFEEIVYQHFRIRRSSLHRQLSEWGGERTGTVLGTGTGTKLGTGTGTGTGIGTGTGTGSVGVNHVILQMRDELQNLINDMDANKKNNIP